MSNRYVNAAASLTTTSSTTIYTVPGGCSALVQSIVAANEDSVTRTVTAQFYDSSAAATFTLIKDAGVPTASSLNMIDRPFVLEEGDQIRITAGTANVMDVLASIMLVDDSTSVPVGTVTTAGLADGAVTAAKIASGLIDSWSTWTPQLYQNGNLTSTIPHARYTRIGDTAIVQGKVSATQAGTAGQQIEIRNLPYSAEAAGDYTTIGNAYYWDGTLRWLLEAETLPTATSIAFGYDSAPFSAYGGGRFGASPSKAVASGHFVSFSLTYEIA